MEIEDLLLYSKPKVIGSGTLPADPSLYPAGGIWVDGANRCQNRWVFHNEGLDYVDCGRPTAVTVLLAPTNDFIVEILTDCKSNGSTSQFLVAFGNTTRQFTMYVSASGAFGCHIGNTSVQTTSTPVTATGYKILKVVKSGTNLSFYVDGVLIETKTISGTTLTAENLFINGVANNPECNTAYVDFKTSTGVLVDCANFMDSNLWSGGTSGIMCSGAPFTITKGSPINERIQQWLPLQMVSF